MEEGESIERGSLDSMVEREESRRSLLMFRPKTKVCLYDIDFSHVLQDVFSEYLSRNCSFASVNSREIAEELENEKCKMKSAAESSVESVKVDRLAEFFLNPTPSHIKVTLNSHFQRLKTSQQKHKKHSEKPTCDNLPTGFEKDQIFQPVEMLVCEKEVPRISQEDKHLKLVIEPDQIIFETYSVGSTFKKCCWLRNRCSSLIKGRIVQPKCSEITLDSWGKVMLSAGLSLRIVVFFTPLDLKPKASSFTLILSRGSGLDKKEFVVPVVTARQTPTLLGFEEINSGDNTERVKFLNMGMFLAGSLKAARFPLTNIGSVATFILTPDVSVCYDDIKDEDCLVIEDGPFTITPAKFTLERKERVHLKVEMRADHPQEFTLDLRILCTDDVCNDQFQLTGQSIYIQRRHFVFNGLEKSFSVSIDDDILAQYFIDLLELFPNGCSSTTFFLKNISGVAVKFHWDLRQAKARGEFAQLPSDCLDVFPSHGVLEPFREHQFQVTCQMKNAQPQPYRIISQLLIDNLTEQCLEQVEDIYKIKNDTSSDNQTMSLIGGEIEVWLEVVLPRVIFKPSVVEFALTDDKQINFMDVEIHNQSHDEVTVEWSRTCGDSVPSFYVQVDPGGAIPIMANSKVTIRLRAQVSGVLPPSCFSVPSVQQTLVFLVNGGEVLVELRLSVDLLKEEVDMEPSRSHLSESHSSSQPQSVASPTSQQSLQEPVFTDLIHLQPTNQDELMKIYKDKINELMSEASCTRGFIQSSQKEVAAKLECDVKACIADGLVLGVTEWGNKVDWIIGDVKGLQVTLIPPEMDLFLFHQFHERNTVLLCNASLLPTSYRWGESYGQDADKLKIWMSKSSGELAPKSKIPIDIFMYPLSTGEVKDACIPCYVDLVPEPLVIKLRGIVEPLRVLLQWDVDRGTHQTLLDPLTNESVFASSVIDSSQMEDIKGISSELQQSLGGASLRKIICNFKDDRVAELCGNRGKGEMDLPNISTNTVVGDVELPWSYDTVPKDSYLLFAECCGPQGCRLGNTVSKILYDKALHFSLATGTSGIQMVSLKNLTPIKTSFSVKAEIYCLSQEAPEYPLYLAEESSFYNEYISAGKVSRIRQMEDAPWKVGLFLDIDPNNKELNSYQEVEIVVKAYPDVWGEYLDVLVISVTGLPQYSLPICVDAYGSPIEFTFDPRKKPHLRFGTLCPNAEESYEVTLKNKTYVPLKIAWVTYCKPLRSNSQDEVGTEPPFSLAVDLHNPQQDLFCHWDLVNYIGDQQSTYFEVSPRVVFVQPYGEAKMSLSVKIPQESQEGVLEGTCLGLIYEDSNQRTKWRSLCHRPTGLSQTFEMQLSCQIQIPTIKIISLDGTKRHLCFTVAAKDIIKKGEVVETREFYLKNGSKAETSVSLEAESPFSLVSVRPKPNEHLSYNKDDNTWQLHPHQIIRVKLLFKANNDMLTLDKELFLNDIEEMIQSSRSSQFLIGQPLIPKTQEVVLRYAVVYPFLKFSSKRLVFGPVFVNETKVQVLRITAISGDEEISIEQDETFKDDDSPFAFSPKCAELQRGRCVEISISFSPSQSCGYLDVLKVKTSVPKCNFYIVLEGVGTWNYKFHQLCKQLKY